MNLHEMFERTVAAESGPPPQPNAPCWCAPGEPYRKCHLPRETLPPISLGELKQLWRRRSNVRVCLHALAPRECEGPIVKAHTVQRAGGLRSIAENGHVLGFALEGS